jgi:hypothetical protein
MASTRYFVTESPLGIDTQPSDFELAHASPYYPIRRWRFEAFESRRFVDYADGFFAYG